MEYFHRHLKTQTKFYMISYQIYGLGFSLLTQMCDICGIHKQLRSDLISVNSVSYTRLVEFLISCQSFFGDPLKREVINNIKNLILNRTYRGTRHKHAYPSRGQRTRTNAQTKKRLFAFYATLYSGKNKLENRKGKK